MIEQVTCNLGNCIINGEANFNKQYVFTVYDKDTGRRHLKCVGPPTLCDDICHIITDINNLGEEITPAAFAELDAYIFEEA